MEEVSGEHEHGKQGKNNSKDNSLGGKSKQIESVSALPVVARIDA